MSSDAADFQNFLTSGAGSGSSGANYVGPPSIILPPSNLKLSNVEPPPIPTLMYITLMLILLHLLMLYLMDLLFHLLVIFLPLLQQIHMIDTEI
jgi:hypothetical protein